MIETIIIVALIAYVAFKEYLQNKTILDLAMQIKAQNLKEYAQIKEATEKKGVEVPDIPAKEWDETDPEDYLKALQKETELHQEQNEEKIKEE